MNGEPLCLSSTSKSTENAAPCRRVPTRGLDVQIVGSNLGLYGKVIFYDSRLEQCQGNVTFGCCKGTYDPLYIKTKEKCFAPYLWVNSQGHQCKDDDKDCLCSARESCSVKSTILQSDFTSCGNALGGADSTRSCLCAMSKGFAVDIKGRTCLKCSTDNYITSDGYCTKAMEKVDRIWDHDSVVFQLPSGIGVGHKIAVSVSGQTTESSPFDYEPPVITEVTPKEGPTSGTTEENNFIVTLKGFNFGNHDAEVHMGTGEECEGNNDVQGPDVCLYRVEIVSQDHEIIKFKLPAGIGYDAPIRVRVGKQISNMDITFSYSVPVVTSVYPLNGRTDGFSLQPKNEIDEFGRTIMPDKQLITLIGDNFGTVGERERIFSIGVHYFKGFPVNSSNTMLQFILPQGTGLNHTIRIEVGGQVTTSAFEFDFNAPIVYPLNHTTWTPQRGNSNFPAENGKYYAPTTGCANPEGQMADVSDPENPPAKRGCIGSAKIIIRGENFGCCVHSETEIIRNNGVFSEDCPGLGPACEDTQPPRVVLTDENGLVKQVKVNSYSHYKIEVDLPEGTGKSILSVEVGPDWSSRTMKKSQDSVTYIEVGDIGFSYSKPQLTETKFGFEISGADITNSFDATGSSKYGTLDGEKDTQWKLFLFGDNFGASQSPTSIEVLAGFYNDGSPDWKNCTEPVWHEPNMHSAGFPYLSCYPPAVTVGNKKWRISIGSNSQEISYTIYGRPIMGKCPPNFYGLTDEYCVKCWNYNTDAAPDSPIMLANCSGIYDSQIQVWKNGKLVTVGGTTEPIARFGYSIWPPKECASGQCDKRSYKGLLPQEVRPCFFWSYFYASLLCLLSSSDKTFCCFFFLLSYRYRYRLSFIVIVIVIVFFFRVAFHLYLISVKIKIRARINHHVCQHTMQ